MTCDSKRLHRAGLLALSVVAVGCGGGAKGTIPANAAKDATGNVVRSSSGAAVTLAAEENWKDGIAEFEAAEKEGWTPEKCDSVSSRFQKANRKQGGKFAEAVYMSGLAVARCDKTDEALAKYKEALDLDPKLCGARVGLGIHDYNNGRTQQAFSAFERAVKDDARCTEGYANLAIMQMERDGAASDEPLNNLRRALAIDAQYLPAFNQMALLFLDRAQGNAKMLDLAAVVCRQAQLNDPEYAPIYNTWGLINMEKENVFDALRMFERAIQLDATNFAAHMNFGAITLSFRGYGDAKTAFAKAVELNPKSYDAQVGLGAALRGLGETEAAKQAYEAAQKLDGGRPEAYFNLGLLYQDYMSGSIADMRQALKYYDQFASRARGSQKYKATLDDVERRCKSDEARKKRRSSKTCRPGRRQNIELAVEALTAMEEMQKEAAAQNPEPDAP